MCLYNLFLAINIFLSGRGDDCSFATTKFTLYRFILIVWLPTFGNKLGDFFIICESAIISEDSSLLSLLLIKESDEGWMVRALKL